jgi:hypothetical protein
MAQISDETTVLDVATSKYHLFWRTTKRNGISVVPFEGLTNWRLDCFDEAEEELVS